MCNCFLIVGYLEAELQKDELPINDTGENPPAPLPKEMIGLEVMSYSTLVCCAGLEKDSSSINFLFLFKVLFQLDINQGLRNF